ncbi:hypothetical protein PTTG_27461 [Puccinia triticina 1-1 BBBD Race 1]|uniref:Uncharacterized protein n=1 Tax=Puccinia triticina (isolate 1-1 / race 1 (BBBD)) TaxID=630390 RepID=A0A180GJT7_PUCT1|nr:hypothetical protein PTTG_27461 [Puccinia triticina 1-1 BBBD Race 1]
MTSHSARLILRSIQLQANPAHPPIDLQKNPFSGRIRIRRNSKTTNLKQTPTPTPTPNSNTTQSGGPLPSQSGFLPSAESSPKKSKSSNKSSPELVSSFQEPLSNQIKSKPIHHHHHPHPPPVPPPPKPNPSTSLTTPSSSPNEFTVLPTHAFHTHRFVKQLERSNFQSESAKHILKFVETSLRSSEKRWLLTGPSGGIVSKSYAEGQAYLYNAALGELRTEVQVKARNDGIVLKSASNSVQREIDNLKQKLKEDISALKNELQLEFNHRKEEASDDQKKLELSIQELNSKFTILVSEVRTEIETRKWVTTRRCVVAIASLALCVVIFTALENQQSLSSPSSSSSRSASSRSPSSSSPPSSSATHSSNSADDDRKLLLKDQIMRSVEELGILPEREDTETDYNSSSNSFFGSSSPVKRIGE